MTSELLHPPHKASTVLVKQSPLFASLPAELLTEMAEHFQLEQWSAQTDIHPDRLLKQFFYILDGQIEYKRSNPDTGREITLEMLYPGDSFDIVCLLDNQPHDVMISTLGTVRLISLPIDLMRKWIWTYPELNKQLLPYLAQKIRFHENQTTNLALYDIPTRLSRIILDHLNKIRVYRGSEADAHKDHLINGLSDDVLARMAGSVRQVINKQLQQWKSQGILSKKRNQIMINDLAALYEKAKTTQHYFFR